MTTLNKCQCLIYGFIRAIEKLLGNNQIIPVEVIHICSEFYSISLKLFIFTKTKKLHLANIDNKTISNIIMNEQNNITINKKMEILSCCYIPELSTHIHTKGNLTDNSCQDGMVGIMRTRYGSLRQDNYHPFVLLFNSTAKDQNIHSNLYLSSTQTPTFNMVTPDMTYCNEYGVIYSHEGLCQLKLEDIDIYNAKNFNFAPMLGSVGCQSFASIELIQHTQKLFVIEGFTIIEMVQYLLSDQSQFSKEIVKKSRRCSVLDLNTKELIDLNPFKYERYEKQLVCSVGICKNNIHNNNLVYIVTNRGHTAKYDIFKNKWNMILQDIDEKKMQSEDTYSRPNVFMDDSPNILYCQMWKEFKCLDLRNNKKEWMSNDITQFIVNTMDMYKTKLTNIFV